MPAKGPRPASAYRLRPFTDSETAFLEAKFRDWHYPQPEDVEEMAEKLAVSTTQIQKWYSNRRYKNKPPSPEVKKTIVKKTIVKKIIVKKIILKKKQGLRSYKKILSNPQIRSSAVSSKASDFLDLSRTPMPTTARKPCHITSLTPGPRPQKLRLGETKIGQLFMSTKPTESALDDYRRGTGVLRDRTKHSRMVIFTLPRRPATKGSVTSAAKNPVTSAAKGSVSSAAEGPVSSAPEGQEMSAADHSAFDTLSPSLSPLLDDIEGVSPLKASTPKDVFVFGECESESDIFAPLASPDLLTSEGDIFSPQASPGTPSQVSCDIIMPVVTPGYVQTPGNHSPHFDFCSLEWDGMDMGFLMEVN